MFNRSTPESRAQARRDAVVIGATQARVQARVASSRFTAPVVVTAAMAAMIFATEVIESIIL